MAGNSFQHLEIDGGSSTGALQIDQVNSGHPGIFKLFGYLQRTLIVNSFTTVIPLHEPGSPALHYGNRRNYLNHDVVFEISLAGRSDTPTFG
jgi:hypothetical protein